MKSHAVKPRNYSLVTIPPVTILIWMQRCRCMVVYHYKLDPLQRLQASRPYCSSLIIPIYSMNQYYNTPADKPQIMLSKHWMHIPLFSYATQSFYSWCIMSFGDIWESSSQHRARPTACKSYWWAFRFQKMSSNNRTFIECHKWEICFFSNSMQLLVTKSYCPSLIILIYSMNK